MSGDRKSANRIDRMFEARREAGRAAMIFYVTAGYPDARTTLDCVAALDEAGTDLIELGIPFSDPIADGPTIQKASQVALEGGMTVKGVLEIVRDIRLKSEIPLLFFSAYNPILRFGPERFINEAAAAGVDGLLVPDVPPEEAAEIEGWCTEKNLKLVFLAAPTTDEARARLIAEHSTGFLYYISLRGVTGARQSMAADLREKIEGLRKSSDLPIAVGFGISKPEHARLAGEIADGVVVGSALIDLIAQHAGTPSLKSETTRYAKSLIEALPVRKVSAGAS